MVREVVYEGGRGTKNPWRSTQKQNKNFNFQFRSHRSVVFVSFVQTDATLLVIVDQANVGSVCTALPTLLSVGATQTLHMVSLNIIRVCHSIVARVLLIYQYHGIMHCSSQHCWELLHQFVHHYQH